MIRTAAFFTLVALAGPALAMQGPAPEPEVIRIEVAPEDLKRCMATIAQVMQSPVAQGQPIGATVSEPALPSVTCVAVQV